MYKLIKNSSNQVSCVYKMADNLVIPLDPANTDYQAYLKWLAEGNEPLPADEETQ